MYSAEGRVFEHMFYVAMRSLGCSLEMRFEPAGLDDIVPMEEEQSLRRGGAYARVIRGEAEIVLRYAWMTQNRSSLLTPSAVMDLPTTEMYIAEMGVATGHSTELELAILGLVVVVTVVDRGLRSVSRLSARTDGARDGGWVRALLLGWSIFTDQAIATGHRTQAWERLVWASLAFGAVAANAMRRSMYAIDAMQPRYQHMNTMQEVIRAGIPVGVHDETIYDVLVETSKGPAASSDVLPLVDCFTDTASCLEMLAASRGGFALLANPATIQGNMSAADREKVAPLAVPYFRFPVVTYFARDHPLVENYSAAVLRLMDAGIMQQKFGDIAPAL
ncbi:hypothetical protein ONE63_005000 [Megalurothrips usitatus]|uniref:Uncharacterized protein n=1 Tax=Megalurothrips usitatus TaxID=439358 RepID=A0AAV7X1H8_9NEOP|nr:hypothetical protein ONE63_005000 [Megalurothrips usitatus]